MLLVGCVFCIGPCAVEQEVNAFADYSETARRNPAAPFSSWVINSHHKSDLLRSDLKLKINIFMYSLTGETRQSMNTTSLHCPNTRLLHGPAGRMWKTIREQYCWHRSCAPQKIVRCSDRGHPHGKADPEILRLEYDCCSHLLFGFLFIQVQLHGCVVAPVSRFLNQETLHLLKVGHATHVVMAVVRDSKTPKFLS